MTRDEILDAARQAVTVDRQATHGAPERSFGLIAAYWSAHLDRQVTAADVDVMLALLKLARAKTSPHHADNWVDLAGYAACTGELATDAETSDMFASPVPARKFCDDAPVSYGPAKLPAETLSDALYWMRDREGKK